jgi:hypothetical protein
MLDPHLSLSPHGSSSHYYCRLFSLESILPQYHKFVTFDTQSITAVSQVFHTPSIKRWMINAMTYYSRNKTAKPPGEWNITGELTFPSSRETDLPADLALPGPMMGMSRARPILRRKQYQGFFSLGAACTTAGYGRRMRG